MELNPAPVGQKMGLHIRRGRSVEQSFARCGNLRTTQARHWEHSEDVGKREAPQALILAKYILIAARWIFGVWYFMTGAMWLVTHALGRGASHQETMPGAMAFQKALTESHFMDPLLAVACFLGGGALLVHRTAPLGIAMLAPVVVVIFLFHFLLTENWIWGTLNLIWFMGLTWRYRKAFTPLWTYSEFT